MAVRKKKTAPIKKSTKSKGKVKAKKKTKASSKSKPAESKIAKTRVSHKIKKEDQAPPSLVQMDPTALEIIRRIRNTFSPTYMTLQDLTAKHAQHKGRGSGNHYELKIVSELFNGLSLLQRSQWVNSVFSDLFGKLIHALKLDLKTPDEKPLPEYQPKPLNRYKQSEKKS